MSSSAEVTTLGAVCSSIEDGDWIETKDQGDHGYRLLQISNIGLGVFRETGNFRWVTPEIFTRLRCNAIKLGDVLVARMPEPTGRCWYVDKLPWPAITAVDVAIVRTNLTRLDPLYCSYFLNAPQTLAAVGALTVGTTRTRIKRTDLAALEISLPPMGLQKAVSSILRSIDDRITLLRETSATLEAIAQALFKSWFVDFDPVRAKMEGRDPEGMDDATAAFFPDSFEESELGLVPNSWEWSRLDLIATVVMGLSPKGDSYNFDGVGVPLINGPVEFGEYFPVETKWTDAASRLAEAGDLIFCVRGSTTGRRVVSNREYCIGRGVCAIRSKHGSPGFIYQTISFGLNRLLGKTTGSVFPSLSAPDIKSLRVLNPGERLILAYERTTSSLLHRIQMNHRQAQTLASLRDTLLPRLISGQLRLPEAEAMLAEA